MSIGSRCNISVARWHLAGSHLQTTSGGILMSVILTINVEASRLNPEAEFETPGDVAISLGLTRGQKIATLDRWYQSVQLRMAASNEGMSPEESTDHDTLLLASINAARTELI
jgi:hypothetical protein